MRRVLVVYAMIISTNALAQVAIEDRAPSVSPVIDEPESLLPESCELLEVINGVKIWRGDCVSASALEPRTAKKGPGERKANNSCLVNACRLETSFSSGFPAGEEQLPFA